MGKDARRIVYANKDSVINELSKAEYRNFPCPCGSLKKAKKCCGVHITVHQEFHEQVIKPWIEKMSDPLFSENEKNKFNFTEKDGIKKFHFNGMSIKSPTTIKE